MRWQYKCTVTNESQCAVLCNNSGYEFSKYSDVITDKAYMVVCDCTNPSLNGSICSRSDYLLEDDPFVWFFFGMVALTAVGALYLVSMSMKLSSPHNESERVTKTVTTTKPCPTPSQW